MRGGRRFRFASSEPDGGGEGEPAEEALAAAEPADEADRAGLPRDAAEASVFLVSVVGTGGVREAARRAAAEDEAEDAGCLAVDDESEARFDAGGGDAERYRDAFGGGE